MAESLKTVDEWFGKLDHAKEITTKLHFYYQDTLTGEKRTIWKVAESDITSTSPTSFGLIYMVDNLLTAGPDPDSQVVGRAQGTAGFADLHNIALQMGLNFVFTEGEYKGSTISVLGRNPVVEENCRELPIVGGTGVFRMARGVVITSTYSFDETTSNGVIEFTFYIKHYSV
ncbi:hypothetical protein DH2020_010282 [Rehmannia glutinosa]|uniref:Dirigent protein n=1 Tax=Rehmannia glutinosa TaxID=99300 RepID=A0ABR0XA74_REHGL